MLAEPDPFRKKPRAKTVTKSRVGVELALAGEKGPKGAQKLVTLRLRLSGFGPAGPNREKRQAGITEFSPQQRALADGGMKTPKLISTKAYPSEGDDPSIPTPTHSDSVPEDKKS